jgi:hypothetical protein
MLSVEFCDVRTCVSDIYADAIPARPRGRMALNCILDYYGIKRSILNSTARQK